MTKVRYPGYRQTPLGQFRHAEDLTELLQKTESEDWWLYVPHPDRPMSFTRHTGETIAPGEFLTDLGTIPRFLRIGRLLQPDTYAAVAILHDWLVRQRNCNQADRSFEDSILVQQEALKTWMETHPDVRSRPVFWLTRQALKSCRSRAGWDHRFTHCPPSVEDLIATQRALNRRGCLRKRDPAAKA